jgi:hypothetical protein
MFQSNTNIFGDLNIDPEARGLLETIVRWARIAGIAGLLSAGITLLAAILGIVQSGATGSGLESMAARAGLMMAIPLAIGMAALNIFLVRFASYTGNGVAGENQSIFNQGIKFLQLYFKAMGIIIIIAIGLFVLVIIAFVIGTTLG